MVTDNEGRPKREPAIQRANSEKVKEGTDVTFVLVGLILVINAGVYLYRDVAEPREINRSFPQKIGTGMYVEDAAGNEKEIYTKVIIDSPTEYAGDGITRGTKHLVMIGIVIAFIFFYWVNITIKQKQR
ncbi:hypothetical protein OAI33_09625 [Pirellulaceae bacterium]|nr:hypothetical protein [Pirellulaceae bacterium]